MTVQTNVFVNKQGQLYKRMSLEQRVALRKRYVAKISRWRHPILGYIITAPIVALSLLGTLYLQYILANFTFLGTLSTLALLFVALFWGVGPALFALLLSTIGLDYLFVSSNRALNVNNWQDSLVLLPFVVSGLTIALITAQRERARLNALATEQELQAYAEELETINKKLEEANQTKDQFISIASHELKTPITTIRGQAQLVLRRMAKQQSPSPDTEGVTQALERINEQTGRLTTLIDELLDVSSLRSGRTTLKKRTLDIRELCREVVEDQQLVTQRQIDLDVPSKPVKVQVDRDHLSRVISNLVSNAVKYSPDCVPVEVSVREEDNHTFITVRDHGKGIPRDQQEQIFESFYRTPDAESSSQPGLGLGLAISKGIVEHHGGRIWCESEMKKGSTFWIELPSD